MNGVGFETRIVTPLFSAGTDSKGAGICKEGIRAPSLCGALRFWATKGVARWYIKTEALS
jgi:CRISPR/Cas system CMR-associated protein Cmr1 (group 7 of RAMP superfamily)